MKRSTLALRLIQAGNKTQRKKLIAGNTAIADAALARELKEYCYRERQVSGHPRRVLEMPQRR